MQIFGEVLFFKSRALFLPPASHIQLTQDKLNSLFFFKNIIKKKFLCCTQLEKDDLLENLHVLSCVVQLKSVLLISCVFWIFFSDRWQSTLFQIFFEETLVNERTTMAVLTDQHTFSLPLSLCRGTAAVNRVVVGCADSVEVRRKYFEERFLYSLLCNVNPDNFF